MAKLFHNASPNVLSISLMLGMALTFANVTTMVFPPEAHAVTHTKAKHAAPAHAKKPTPATAGKTQEAAAVPDSEFARVSPIDLLKEPNQYLNKHVDFVGVFNRFSDTGLDYKKAFRDSRDYVSLFILRPDTDGHKIPLSELKLFFPRKKSEEVMKLESGDTIRIKGTVFNTALDEPWVDISDLKILQKSKEEVKKPSEECC